MQIHSRAGRLALVSASLFAAACYEVEGPVTADPSAPVLTGTALQRGKESLGRQLFEDTALSASGTQSCASCHAQEAAFQGNSQADKGKPVAQGAFPTLFGNRNTPTAMYLASAPAFSFVEDEGELVPTGGFFWDGRADSLALQAEGPFLNPREMAMPDQKAVVDIVREADYRSLFVDVFGGAVLNDTPKAYHAIGEAIAAFEKTPRFQPFSSKFDDVLRGAESFTAEEALGFQLFKDPEKGNCIGCHAGKVTSKTPSDWLFTDFTYDNLGVPRNDAIADNDEAAHYDLGLCGQPGLLSRIPNSVGDKQAFLDSLCGAFKVPTLRNVGLTAPYMHNGVFATLRDVVEFYVTRGTAPENWYRKNGAGKTRTFDDLPEQYAKNVNTSEAPYDRVVGQAPRLDDAEIDAIVAFLQTLTDQP
jgi:cytochrome c peroxidase